MPAGAEADVVRRLLFDPDPEVFDGLEEAVFSAILQTRQLLHVHSERIYLMGCGEGAAVAYWLGLAYPERFAGIVAINGWLQWPPSLGRLRACRDLPILVVHGAWNTRAPLHEAAKRRNASCRWASRRLPVLSLLTSPDDAHARRRGYLAHEPLHRSDEFLTGERGDRLRGSRPRKMGIGSRPGVGPSIWGLALGPGANLLFPRTQPRCDAHETNGRNPPTGSRVLRCPEAESVRKSDQCDERSWAPATEIEHSHFRD